MRIIEGMGLMPRHIKDVKIAFSAAFSGEKNDCESNGFFYFIWLPDKGNTVKDLVKFKIITYLL